MKVLKPETVKRTIDVLSKKLISLNNASKDKFFFNYNKLKKDLLISSFSKLLISHAYLSYLFNCWVENIPGIVDVNENNGDQRCLGTFIVGYNMNQEISDSERTVFKITSDRISANLASSAIENAYPVIQQSRARYRQINFLKTFKADLEKYYNQVKHKAESNKDEKWTALHDFGLADTKDWILKYFTEKENFLKDCGLSLITKYFNEISSGDSCDIALLTELNEIPNTDIAGKNNIYLYIDKNDKKEIQHNGRSSINIVFPHYLIEELTVNRTKENGVTITTENENLYIECRMLNKTDHFKRLLDSIGKKDSGKGLGSFLVRHFNEILILGNIEIGFNEKSEFVSKIDMRKDLYLKNGYLQYRGNKLQFDNALDIIVWKINFYST